MDIFQKAHKYLGVTIDMRRDWHIQYRQSADRGLSFIGQIITISGVIAGFGFTAVDNISCKIFFVFGEAFLFLNICMGLYFIKKFWFEDLQQFKKDIDTMSNIADKLKNGLEEKNETSAKDGINELEVFSQDKRDLGKIFNLLPTLMIGFIAVAAVLLLLSL